MAIMHECVSDALNFSEASEPTFEGTVELITSIPKGYTLQ